MKREKTFTHFYDLVSWEEMKKNVLSKTPQDVERVLKKEEISLHDFLALISPAASPYLERMMLKSEERTQKRFGKTIQLYAPLYLSNECNNICTYCGFSLDNKIKRRTLSLQDIEKECLFLKKQKFNHVLLVTGESNHNVGMEYFRKVLPKIRPHFSSISMEVQPLEIEEYFELQELGVHSILLYQETYNKSSYEEYHPKGKKRNFFSRLETPDKICNTGFHKLGIGALLGLDDWRTDSAFVAFHLQYLQGTYWKTNYSISFPRLRPYVGEVQPKSEMKDTDLLQLICAFRLLDSEIELSISTRETSGFRDAIFKYGATTMSVGSKTNPGGYAVSPETLEQFEICDERTPPEFEAVLRKSHYHPLWKDWDTSLEKCPV